MGGLVGGIIGASSARKAAKAQERAANAQIASQEKMREQSRTDLEPWRNAGNTAQSALMYELGLGAAPDLGEGLTYGGYTKTPGYDFRMNQGLDALESSAAAKGGLYSGAAMRDALQYGQDYASSEYGNYLNRLGGMSDAGAAAAGNSTNANAQAAVGISNALGSIGNAQAAGAIGQGTAWQNALGNFMGMNNYQKQVTGNNGGFGNSPIFNSLFGGSGLGGFV